MKHKLQTSYPALSSFATTAGHSILSEAKDLRCTCGAQATGIAWAPEIVRRFAPQDGSRT